MTVTKKNIIKNIVIAVLVVAIAVILIIPLIGSNGSAGAVSRVQIKRTFLVDADDLPWEAISSGSSRDLVQSYVSYSPEIRIRVSNGTDFRFTMKMPLDDVGLARQDVEFPLTEDEYNDLFRKISGDIIYKTRYSFNYDGMQMTVDIFTHQLSGLIFADVEFDSVEDANDFMPPAWFGEDVTADDRYKNAMLSRDGMPS